MFFQEIRDSLHFFSLSKENHDSNTTNRNDRLKNNVHENTKQGEKRQKKKRGRRSRRKETEIKTIEKDPKGEKKEKHRKIS